MSDANDSRESADNFVKPALSNECGEVEEKCFGSDPSTTCSAHDTSYDSRHFDFASPKKKHFRDDVGNLGRATSTMPISVPSRVLGKDDGRTPSPSNLVEHLMGEIRSLAAKKDESEEQQLPSWVAGSSPAVYVSVDELMHCKNGLQNMAIAHEMAVNPEFSVDDLFPQGPIYQTVKEGMHKAFWEIFRESVEKQPPDSDHAFNLLRDLKEELWKKLDSWDMPSKRTLFEETLDLTFLQKRFETSEKKLDLLHECLQSVVSILATLCAPVRDGIVRKLLSESDIVQLFRGTFELLELMGRDMAQFTIVAHRDLVSAHAGQIEREQFQRLLKKDPNQDLHIREWLSGSLYRWLNRKTSNERPKELSHADVKELLVEFYADLLEFSPPTDSEDLPKWRQNFPETLKLDEIRIWALGEKFFQLVLVTSSIFLTTSLLGDLPSLSALKLSLKAELIVILNDVSRGNCARLLENVFLQCEKRAKECAGMSWTEEKSTILKQQIKDLQRNPPNEHRIRQIATSRIRAFISDFLRQNSGRVQIPPGTSMIQREMAALTSQYLRIALHNWNAFGTFYGELLDHCWKTSNKG